MRYAPLWAYTCEPEVVAIDVRTVEYFYARVENESRNAYEMHARLAADDVNLLAFSAIPFGPKHVELTIFPDRTTNFQELSARSGWTLTGPQHAILIQGDDHLGAQAEIHKKLHDAGVRIYAASGVTDGHGRYGYVVYFKEGDHLAAAKALSD